MAGSGIVPEIFRAAAPRQAIRLASAAERPKDRDGLPVEKARNRPFANDITAEHRTQKWTALLGFIRCSFLTNASSRSDPEGRVSDPKGHVSENRVHFSARRARVSALSISKDLHDRPANFRMDQPDHPLDPRDHGHRLDRLVLLLHSSRSQPEEAGGPSGRRRRRGLAGPWRRLLQHAQVSRCAARTAEGADLVQVGELFDLDQRLLPDRLGLLPSRRSLHHRSGCPRPGALAGAGHRHRRHRSELARL